MSEDFVNTPYKEIDLDEKRSIVISKSTRLSDKSVLVDIRLYRLYHDVNNHVDDNVKRPTQKGIKFKPEHIIDIIDALCQIYKSEFGGSDVDVLISEINKFKKTHDLSR